MELVFQSQWLQVWDNVLSKSYCEKIKKTQLNQLENQQLRTKDYRTSNQSFIDAELNIDDRINDITFELTKIPKAHYEETSVIRYEKGQEYKIHHDYFHHDDPDFEGSFRNGGHRIATALFILDGKCKGGETYFPHMNHLRIKPKTGRCIIWQNIFMSEVFGRPRIQYNTESEHAGLPVESGEKWIATKWIREAPSVWYHNKYKKK